MSRASILKTLISNHKGDAAMVGFGLWSGADTYQSAREAGDGKISAGLQAAGEFALPYVLGGWGYAAYSLATEAPELAVDAMQWYDQKSRTLGREARGRAFQNADFNDTDITYSMRQAGMSIAARSRYNTQLGMMGKEAKYMKK